MEPLPPEVLERLRPLLREERLAAGTTVVREGDAGGRFYLVLEGELEVTQQGRGRRGVLRPGDTFGEVALALRVPRTATVRALTDVSLGSCGRPIFDELVLPVFSD